MINFIYNICYIYIFMEIYLDSGNIDEIKKISKLGLISGVTTNPTLIANEGKDFFTVLNSIIGDLKLNIGDDFTVSAEVTDLTSSNSMVDQGRKISKIDKHILVKIPLTKEGLKAVKILSFENIRCNVTLCFSANQALLAARAGAWCVSPFIGRVDDEGFNGLDLIRDIRLIYDNYGFETKILAASIRSTSHVLECAKIGADLATMPGSVIEKLYYNPLTDIGLEQFNSDWEKYSKNLNK